MIERVVMHNKCLGELIIFGAKVAMFIVFLRIFKAFDKINQKA